VRTPGERLERNWMRGLLKEEISNLKGAIAMLNRLHV
jgi:hypothetical protein